ncbi:MAG: nucleotide-binding protein [Promethearchaeota archaeon]
MKKVISFSGKGGVGKTTTLVLFLKYILEQNDHLDILVIDSDPDANVADVIGQNIKFSDTIGGKMRVLKDKIQKRQLPLDVPKNQIIEGDVYECLIELDEFDIIEMGRTEGEGCYCYINAVLKNVIDTLSKNYDITIIDSPAGLEHFARKTGRDVTDLIIVTDPSKMGLHTMRRILEITREVELQFENIWVLGNRFSDNLTEILEKEVENLNDNHVKFLGVLPNDDNISEFNMKGENLLKISQDNPTYQKAKEIFSKIL